MDAFIGIPAIPELSKGEIKFLKALDIPAVSLSVDASNDGIDSVVADAELGGMLAAEYLIKLGHRRLAYLHGEPDSPLSSGKFNGFKRQCLLAGLDEPERIDCGTKQGEHSTRKSHAAFSKMLTRGAPSFTGLAADSDNCAIGVIRACHEAGVDVPGALSVVSFNNVLDAEFHVPSISSIDYNYKARAEAAYALILRRLETKLAPGLAKVVAPKLVARESSAKQRGN